MGRRFLLGRYPLDAYSDQRAQARLNEGDFEPHRMRPYGLGSGHFNYRQMFGKKHQSRQGNRLVDRAAKKATRQQARRELRAYGVEMPEQAAFVQKVGDGLAMAS